MARLFDDAANEYLVGSGLAPVTAPPISMAGWFYVDDAGQGLGWPFCLHSDTTTLNWFGCRINSSGVIYGTCRNSTDVLAQSAGTWSVNTWHHVTVTATESGGAITVNVWVDGANNATDTETVSFPDLDDYLVATRYGTPTTIAEKLSGKVAEVGTWNVALDADDAAALAAGVSPFRVRPDGLVDLRRLLNDDGDRDWTGNRGALTPTNTPTYATDHPPVLAYTRPSIIVPQVAAATDPGTRNMLLMGVG